MKNKNLFGIIAVLLSLFLVNIVNAEISEYPQITEQTCSLTNHCPEGLDCFSFPSIGLRCAELNPCTYYECPEGTECLVQLTYPGSVVCSCVGPECPATSGDQNTVSKNIEPECVKEGKVGLGFNNDVCCEGLKRVGNSKPFNGKCISPTDSSFVCTNCGDGVCGLGENYCNCPEDCSNEDLTILYTTVIDKTNDKPIEDAIVYLGYHSTETRRCHTDADGKCSIKDKHFFVEGVYGLGVFKKGYNRYAKSSYFEKGDNYLTIELEKKSEIPTSVSISGTVIEIITAEGSKSENHYFKIKDDRKNEEYIFNEVGENYDFDEFVNKRVEISGFREVGFIGWQHEEVEGIYVEEILDELIELDCIKEGEWGWPPAVCCEGLKNVGNWAPMSNGECTMYRNPSFKCTKCGNGVCGLGENYCNCPEDCKDEAVPDYPQITEQECDIMNPCSGGLDCFSFPGIGLRCAEPNPCTYYECPEGTECLVAESYPGQVMCSCIGPECPAIGGHGSDEDTVSQYNLLTETVVQTINSNKQTVSNKVSLWKTTDENRGILKTSMVSAEYSGRLFVKSSKLFMDTSLGEKLINILPEDAVSKAREIAETPEIREVELKEEAEKPIYSLRGIKQARLLFIIPVSMKIETKIDAETTDVISVNKPWWSFLAW